MAGKDPRIDAYIAKAAPFARPILKHLRKVVHAGCPEVEETLKWSMPHFDYKGIMCGMAAFKKHCAFGFWKSSLVLGDPGDDREGMGSFGCITTISELPSEKVLIGYVRKAATLNDAGIKNSSRPKPRKATALDVPDDLSAALKKNKKARTTFDGFSTSKRNDYIDWITGAKREATRQQRLATSIEWLAAGKAHNWKYERP